MQRGSFKILVCGMVLLCSIAVQALPSKWAPSTTTDRILSIAGNAAREAEKQAEKISNFVRVLREEQQASYEALVDECRWQYGPISPSVCQCVANKLDYAKVASNFFAENPAFAEHFNGETHKGSAIWTQIWQHNEDLKQRCERET